MNNIENLGLIPYLNSQLDSAWDLAAYRPSYVGMPEEYLCGILNMSLKTDPQIGVELDQFVEEAMKQLISDSVELHEDENNYSFFDYLDTFCNVTGKVNSAVGYYAGYQQYNRYVKAEWNGGVGKWRGKNGVWYLDKVEGKGEFHGNQYTGSKSNIILLLSQKNMLNLEENCLE